MQSEQVLKEIHAFVARELLDGKAADLEANTPLLAWGIIDSFSLAMLLKFLKDRFQVEVPLNQVSAANLESLTTITQLVMSLSTPRVPAELK